MAEELKPHQIAQLVNKLRDIATKYHAHGCLRELISREVNAALTQRPAAQTEREADGLPLIVAGAIFDFAGFMTTRSEVIEVGSTAEAGPVADLVKEWAELRGLNLADAAVLSWQLHINRASLLAPQQATPEPVKHKCRHCGVTTIEDEDGVTMQGLPAPEHPIIFDPSADVPIPATPDPVGERWVVVRETTLDVGDGNDVRTGGRPELGYALISDAATFGSEDEAVAAIKSASLPVGWVVLPLSRLLPDLMATHPAPGVPDGFALVPVKSDDAILRPFYNCPPDELGLAWDAALRVAQVRRGAAQAKGADHG